jgi:hypothetical protein
LPVIITFAPFFDTFVSSQTYGLPERAIKKEPCENHGLTRNCKRYPSFIHMPEGMSQTTVPPLADGKVE